MAEYKLKCPWPGCRVKMFADEISQKGGSGKNPIYYCKNCGKAWMLVSTSSLTDRFLIEYSLRSHKMIPAQTYLVPKSWSGEPFEHVISCNQWLTFIQANKMERFRSALHVIFANEDIVSVQRNGKKFRVIINNDDQIELKNP